MSDTADSPTRRRQIAREMRARRKLARDIKANSQLGFVCSCDCHTGNPAAHVGQKCPCKEARRRLVS